MPDDQATPERPWLGLRSFTEATAGYFFGRAEEIQDLFQRVLRHPLTVLYSESGLGKTSLLGAGLIPRMRDESHRPVLLRLGYDKTDPPLVEQIRAAMLSVITREEKPEDFETGRRGDGENQKLQDEVSNDSDAKPQHEEDPQPPSASEFHSLIVSKSHSLPSSLWELLHHRDTLPDPLNPPVLILDQFEEIFTLGQQRRPVEARNVLQQLAELVENRPPAALRQRFQANRDLARSYDAAASPLRIVFSLREDYLYQLDAWRGPMPSIMRNRMSLAMLRGPEAFQAVMLPGQLGAQSLVDGEAAAAIVRFVAGAAPKATLESIAAVPPLLSLVCAELNEARLAEGRDSLTLADVADRADEVLTKFYERCFVGQSPALRLFVEEKLLTKEKGYRDSVARETALEYLVAQGGLTETEAVAALDRLVRELRLLSTEERGGQSRMELTHDVLTPVVKKSRDHRQAEEAREKAERDAFAAREQEAKARRQRNRLRRLVATFVLLTLLALVSSLIGWFKTREATQATRKALDAEAKAMLLNKEASIKAHGSARAAFQRNDFRVGMAYLAEALRYDMNNQIALRDVRLRLQKMPDLCPLRVITPHRHENGVSKVTFSPDGSKIIVIGWKACRVWDVATGQPVGKLIQHGMETSNAVFSPNGLDIVVSNPDKARIWNITTGQPKSDEVSHRDYSYIESTSFNPNGTRIVTANNNAARVWDADTGRTIADEIQPEESVTRAAFSPDGSKIITVCSDNTVRIWDAVTRLRIGQALEPTGYIISATFSLDSAKIVTLSGSNLVKVWDATTGEQIGDEFKQEASISSVAFGPDSERIVTVAANNKVGIWSTSSSEESGIELEHEQSVISVKFSSDGVLIFTACKDGTVRAWDATTGQTIGEPVKCGNFVESVTFSPDGSKIVIVKEDDTVEVWSTIMGHTIDESFYHRGNIIDAGFSPNGTKIVTGSADNTAQIWDAVTGKAVGEALRHDDKVTSVAFGPDGSKIVTASADNGTMQIWDTNTRKCIGNTFQHGQKVNRTAFTKNGLRIITYSTKIWSRTVRLWEVATGQPVGNELVQENEVVKADFSPDGSKTLIVNKDGTAQLGDVITGNIIGDTLRHEDKITNARFSPDSACLITISLQKEQLWNAVTGQAMASTPKQEGNAKRAEFSPDGSRMLVFSKNGTALLQETTTGKTIGEPLRHIGLIVNAEFSPEGNRVCTMSDDKTARIWDVTTAKAVSDPLPLEGKQWDFSSVGNHFIIYRNNGLGIWDIITGQVVGETFFPDKLPEEIFSYSPDGTKILFENKDGTVQLWPLAWKAFPPAPVWLGDHVAQLGGMIISKDGSPEEITQEQRDNWKAKFISKPPDGSDWDRIIRWRLADSHTRTIDPFSSLTVPQYVEREITWASENYIDGDELSDDSTKFANIQSVLSKAYALDPNHPLIHFALAMVEENEQCRRLLFEFGLKRLPVDDVIQRKVAKLFFKPESTQTPELNQMPLMELEAKGEKGDTICLFQLAWRYATGSGIERNHIKAAKLFAKAISIEKAKIMTDLGIKYANGTGVEKNNVKAFFLFKKAANLGNVWAINNLGVSYMNGVGIEKNGPKAFELFTKATELGDDQAMANLAVCYLNSIGTEQNVTKAIELLGRAVAFENYKAMYILAQCHERGIGCQLDISKALELYKKAADLGHLSSLERLKEINEKIKQNSGKVQPKK